MNLKKIICILIILVAIFSCLSIVSAGWFDLPSDDKDKNPEVVHLNITNSSCNIEKELADDTVTVTIEYNITIDISSLNESQKESLAENFSYGSIILENSTSITIGDANVTVDGDKLIIEGSTQVKRTADSDEFDFGAKIIECDFDGGDVYCMAYAE